MQLRYSHRSWNDPVIAEVSGNGEVVRQEQSGNLVGRFIFENLVPGTEYKARVSINDEFIEMDFKTLPEPQTERLFRIAFAKFNAAGRQNCRLHCRPRRYGRRRQCC